MSRTPAAILSAFACLLAAVALASCSVEITASRYALVYGAADYDGTSNDLGCTDDDAGDMAAALSSAGWTVLAEREPTNDKTTILADIAALESVVDSDSTVLFFFSGHGGEDSDGNLYFIPTAATTYDECITPTELRTALNALPCRNRVAILDTCYSGAFVLATDTGSEDAAAQDYGTQDDGTSASTFLTALANYGSLLASAFNSYDPYTPIYVTASGAEEYSYEEATTEVLAPYKYNSTGNGVFTKYFLQAATTGDTNGDGCVTIQEAYVYAKKMVEAKWDAKYSQYSSVEFLPRISGNARDIVIF